MSEPNAESDVVTLSLPDIGAKIDKWLEYECRQHFLTPSTGFSFRVDRATLPSNVLDAIKSGTRCTIECNGHTQATGYLDRVTTSYGRGEGTILHIEGSDRLAQAVRAGMDPQKRYTAGQNLEDVLSDVFLFPFGFGAANFTTTNDLNRNILTGQTRGKRVSKKGKILKSFAIHQTKPYHGEGIYAFASRISQRFGFWIWLNATGDGIVVGQPDFDQGTTYVLRNVEGQTPTANILRCTSRDDSSGQPSCIVAYGFTFGGENDRSATKVIVVNELVATGADGFPTDQVSAIIAANQDAIQLPLRTVFPKTAMRAHPAAQPIYPKDQESQTPEQLQNYARRELALKQRDSLHVTYTVAGHTNNGAIWAVDTMVDVDDDFAGIHEPLWVLGRTFHKSRATGTMTTLELIRPHTIDFAGTS